MKDGTKKKATARKPQQQRGKAGAFKMPGGKSWRKTAGSGAAIAMPSNSDLPQSKESLKWEEYLIYRKLKEEMAEFYPYPGLWLETPHQLLGGRSPLEIALASPKGTEFILDMIQSIKAGYFS